MRARQERDYRNLRETERIWEAVNVFSTNVKDYSLRHLARVAWRISDYHIRKRLVRIDLDAETGLFSALLVKEAVETYTAEDDKNGWIPRKKLIVYGHDTTKPMIISTNNVNFECLRDHVAEVTIGENTAIIDLEELLKATRYA